MDGKKRSIMRGTLAVLGTTAAVVLALFGVNANAAAADNTSATDYEAAVENGVKVFVDAPEGALPEGAELHAELVESEKDTQAVADELEKAEVSYDGFLALDVFFTDVDGNEVEPVEPVDVRFELPEGTLPEGAEDLAVHHLAEAEDGTVAEVEAVADDADVTEGTVERAADPVEGEPAAVAEFSVDSFSWFTLTYTNQPGGPESNNRVNVHLVDENGVELFGGEVDFSDLSDTYSPADFGEKWLADQWVSVEKLTDTWAAKTEGYEFVGAYADENLQTSLDWIRYNTSGRGEWRYRGGNGGSGQTLSNLYLVFHEVASSEQTTVTIEDSVSTVGKLTARYSGSETPFYVWQKLVNGEWQAIDQLRVNGDQYLYDDEDQSSLNVVLEVVNDDTDEGGSWYCVSAYSSREAYENGTEGPLDTSAAMRLDYYDQLQNGDFETPNVNELSDGEKNNYQYPVGTKDLVWDTTGSDQQIEIVNSTDNRDSGDYNNSYGAQSGVQYAELNCQAAGALYQDVLTVPGTELNWQFYHRGRNGQDTMYLVIAPADGVRDVQTQSDLEDLIDKIQRNVSGYTEADGYFLYSATDGNNSWGYHSSNSEGTGAYEVPNDQYLTRFFFVAGNTASGNDTVGNLLDNVRFTTELLPAQQGQANLTITKVVTGVAADDADALNDYTVTVNVDGKTVTLDSFNQRSDGSWYATGYTTVDGITANGNKTVTVTESAGDLAGYVSNGSTVSVNSGAAAEGTSAEIILQDRGSGTVVFTNAYEKFAPEANKRIRDNGDGSYTLSLDVKGSSRTETTPGESGEPLDIVLVLDMSGSMDEDFGASSSKKIDALKTAVSTFVDSTAAQNDKISDPAKQHKISIVKFAGNKKDEIGNDTYWVDEGFIRPDYQEYNNSQRVTELTAYTTASSNVVKSVINSFDPKGATRADYGMQLAQSELTENGRLDAKKVVIFFTDGDPTSGNEFESSVANGAVTAANQLKSSGTEIYTVGIFSGASTTGNSDSNKFMQAVSSNFPDATSYNNRGERASNDYYKTAATAGDLNNIFEEISEDITTSYAFSKVSIVDELSRYAKIDESKVIYEDLAGSDGFCRVSSGVTLGVTNADGNPVTSGEEYPSGVTFWYKPGAEGENSTGTIKAVFPEGYVLQDGWTYDMRFDVVPTDAAYSAYEGNVAAGGNGYGNVTGDADTDLPDNATSSGKPGFHSNLSAYVQYDVDGTTDKVYYDHPVIQAASLTITDVLKVTKTMNGHELDAQMFDFTVTPKRWDNGATGENLVEVTAQQAAEKAGLKLVGGVYTYTNPTKAAEDTASTIRMGSQIRFTRADVGKTYVYEYAEVGSGLHEGYTEISSDNVTFDQNRYRIELAVTSDDAGKINVTMSKYVWDAAHSTWPSEPSETQTIHSANCNCVGSEPLMTIGFKNSYSKTYGLDIFKGEFELNEDGTIKKDPQGNPVVNTNAPLSGAEFTLFSDSGCTNEVAKAVTGENGQAILPNLSDGTYYLRETRVPSGYQLLGKTITVTIADGKATFTVLIDGGVSITSEPAEPNADGNFEFSVGNKPNPDLPSSGSSGAVLVMSSGFAAIALGGAYLARRRMKPEV